MPRRAEAIAATAGAAGGSGPSALLGREEYPRRRAEDLEDVLRRSNRRAQRERVDAVPRWAEAVAEAVGEGRDVEPSALADRVEDLTRRVEDLERLLGPPERRAIDRPRERRERRAPRERMVEVLLEKRKKGKGKEE